MTKDGKIFVIRNAVCEDALAITNVSNQVIRETPYLSRTENDTPEKEENTRDYVADCFSSEKDAFLVAELDREIVGFGHLDGYGSRLKYLHRCRYRNRKKYDAMKFANGTYGDYLLL